MRLADSSLEKIMDDRLQHFAAHPYFLMGVKNERDAMIELVMHEWDNYCADDKNALTCTICAVFENLANQLLERQA